jgi:hypothetical protein
MGRRNPNRGAPGLALIKIHPSRLNSHNLDDHARHSAHLTHAKWLRYTFRNVTHPVPLRSVGLRDCSARGNRGVE